MADATDLKSVDPKGSCGFESRHRYPQFTRKKASGLDPEAFFVCRGLRRIKDDWMRLRLIRRHGTAYKLLTWPSRQDADWSPRNVASESNESNTLGGVGLSTSSIRQF